MTDKRRSGKRAINAAESNVTTLAGGDRPPRAVSEDHESPAGTERGKLKSGRVIRIDGESCPVVHAHMIVLTRGNTRGPTRVILF